MSNYNNGQGFGQREMAQGDWKCSQCEAEIKELPFQPDGERPIYCRDCHRQLRQKRRRY